MYKWPQGRVIRTICLLLALVIAADLGYNGAYGRYVVYAQTATVAPLGVAIVFTALALAALVSGLVLVGFRSRSVDFLIEVEQEMKRVEWPKANDVWRSTLVIAVVVVVLALVLAIFDYLYVALVKDGLLWMADRLSGA